MSIEVFITDLAAYNEGNLVGKWVQLPMDEDELEETIQKILEEGHCGHEGCFHEEWFVFVTDYEAPFKVGEHENISTLNEWAERLEDCREEDDVIRAIFDHAGSVEEGFAILEDGRYRVFYDCRNMADVAWTIVDERGLLSDIPENIARYFDYKSYGIDLRHEGTFICIPGGKYLEIW